MKKKIIKAVRGHRHKWLGDESCPCCGFEEQYCMVEGCYAMRSREHNGKWDLIAS